MQKRAASFFLFNALVVLGSMPGTSYGAADEPLAEPLETIVVTARRREELLQEVPIPISTVSGKTLDQQKWSGLFEQIFLIYKWKTCGFTLPLGPLTATR